MNTYELTLVLDGKASSAKKKAVQDKAAAMIATFKGKMGRQAIRYRLETSGNI